MDEAKPTYGPARYAKGKFVVHCPSDGSGMKTRAMRLTVAHGGRWSNRSGYIVASEKRAKEIIARWEAGYDAHTHECSPATTAV